MSDYEFIEEGDMEFTPRGRKSNVPPALVAALGKLTKGKALLLNSLAVDLKAKDAKTAKARVGAVIRSAAKQANVAVTIHWSSTGIPQAVRKS
jgi:hypothetical protein